jgi:ATP-dependent helicase HrpA
MSTPPPDRNPSIRDLRARLQDVSISDADRFHRRLARMRSQGLQDEALHRLAEDFDAAEQRLQARRVSLPVVRYPGELPVSQRRDDIAAALASHQVIVVAGETGSGKTTQLPKICLELGRGIRGRIGHTQPRRIAARSVAARIAEELGTPLGSTVGFAVRFADQVSEQSAIKVMTDGILLAEIQRDRDLRQYDTLIIDEAHERSLTIDFILGYLRTLLPRRPDLKVIVTSATIDPYRFAAHFGDAPVIEVSGRTFPVEMRYRPLVADVDTDEDLVPDEPRDQLEAIVDAVAELTAEGPGDILVFLSGEREIRDTAQTLDGLNLPNTEIIPLFARLSAAEQLRVFSAHTGRRIVLSTNIAETSLTVPGIRYVIDAGMARISRYSQRTKVQRLPIEAISQASANQRSGRCGRLSDGICIRLYSQRDFDSRPEFTEPEILRTSLASVLLQMAALRLGDVGEFGFIDPPDQRAVRDGVAALHELGAFNSANSDPNRALTDIGRQLAKLPVDPRLGRMLLAAVEQGCVAEVMVIVAGLTIQDPRERPRDQEQAAATLHARFADEHSDFDALLNLWRYVGDQQRELSGNQFRKMCRAEFLHYLRIREWQDLVSQLRRIGRTLGIRAQPEPANSASVHTALLTGLLSQIGMYDATKREYLGARNARFVIAPGTPLAKKSPGWVMAAELVETNRLYARMVARTDPQTIEQVASHLVTRTYSEPRWDSRRSAAVAGERVTLYGVPLVTGRTVPYARIDPDEARELFIQHALIERDWVTRHHFFRDNQQMLDEVSETEERLRRRDVLVEDEVLADFYRHRIPADVVSGRHFDSWWKRARQKTPTLLNFTRELLIRPDVPDVDEHSYPDRWRTGDLALSLSYRFDPGAVDDGVTIEIPLDVLNRVDPDLFDWQIPARREELITALLRALPKNVRRELGPAPDRARALLADLGDADGALLPSLERAIHAQTGVLVEREDWQLDRLPDHLRTSFVVVDDDAKVVAKGSDLHAIRAELAPSLQVAMAQAAPDLERLGLSDWDFDELPRVVENDLSGHIVQGFPSLVDDGANVSIRILATAGEQRAAMITGVRRLLLLTTPAPTKAVLSQLSARARLTLGANPDGSLAALGADVLAATIDELVARHGGAVFARDAFIALRDQVRADLAQTLTRTFANVERALAAAHALDMAAPALIEAVSQSQDPAIEDLRRQRAGLLYPGFVTGVGSARLPDLTRYLQAMNRRVEQRGRERDVDAARMSRLHLLEEALQRAQQLAGAGRTEELAAVRWMLEELRVSLFAQNLGTAYPVSDKRIYRAIDQITRPSG